MTSYACLSNKCSINFKQHAFKIPKKQQIEERKEHERELNLSEVYIKKEPLAQSQSCSNFNPRQNSNFYNRNHNRFSPIYNTYEQNNSNRFRVSPASAQRYPQPYRAPSSQYDFPASSGSIYSQTQGVNQNQTAPLTKEQRRQLFEEKAKQEEAAREAQLLREQQELEAAAAAASRNTLAFEQQQQHQIGSGPSFEQRMMKYDSKTNQWISPYQMHINNNQAYNLPNKTSIQERIDNLNLNLNITDLNNLKQAVKKFMPVSPVPVPVPPPPPPPPSTNQIINQDTPQSPQIR